MKFGILGAGKMGSSIMYGTLNQGLFTKDDLLLSVKFQEEKDLYLEKGFKVVDIKELYEQADILLLSVKPQQIEEIFEVLKNAKKHPRIVISILAGMKSEYIKERLKGPKIVRVMPNTPALIKEGMSAIAYHDLSKEEEIIVKKIFDGIGQVVIIKEEMMNEVIPLNGSFPAYGYYFLNAFIKKGVEMGFSYEDSKKLVCQSMIGSTKMILESEKPIENLINDVCSKGGTTIEGVYVFDSAKLDDIVSEACDKCVARAYELGKK